MAHRVHNSGCVFSLEFLVALFIMGFFFFFSSYPIFFILDMKILYLARYK